MRQRFAKKRDEQESIEKNQVLQADSRRSNTLTRADEGIEQWYPEKVILLAKGIKISWKNISLSHRGFKTTALHHAAKTLQNEKLGMVFFNIVSELATHGEKINRQSNNRLLRILIPIIF